MGVRQSLVTRNIKVNRKRERTSTAQAWLNWSRFHIGKFQVGGNAALVLHPDLTHARFTASAGRVAELAHALDFL